MSDVYDSPEYLAAVERENSIRDLAFTDLQETICGVDVLPLTPLHWIWLTVVGSCFARGGTVTPEEIARFLWHVSPEFKVGDTEGRDRFTKSSFANFDWPNAKKEIEDYIEEAFGDSGGGSNTRSISYTNWPTKIVHIIATSYKWTERDIVRTPFKRLFLYMKEIERDSNPKAGQFNPISGKVISKYLKAKNAHLHEKAE